MARENQNVPSKRYVATLNRCKVILILRQSEDDAKVIKNVTNILKSTYYLDAPPSQGEVSEKQEK